MTPILTRRLAIRFALFTLLLSACNLPIGGPSDGGGESPPANGSSGDSAGELGALTVISVLTSEDTLRGPQCMPSGLGLRAFLQSGDDPIENVRLTYRLVREFDGQTSAPFEIDMRASEGDDAIQIFEAQLAEAGAQAVAEFDGGPGSFEFQVIATDASGASAQWPADQSLENLPVVPCDPVSGLSVIGGDAPVPQAEYGQAPGCVPSTLGFTLTLANTHVLDEAWVNTRWYTGQPPDGGQPASDLIKLPLTLAGESEGNPGAADYTVELQIQDNAIEYLDNGDGYLSWQLQARDTDGAISAWPESAPDPVLITACGPDENGPAPTATQLGLAPLATPTQQLGLAPPTDIQESGNSVTLYHEQAFDLDTGLVVSANSPAADFVLITDDDPYVDSLNPVNGAFVGWAGFEALNSAEDCDILKASMPMGLGWPDMDESFFCFDTSEGRIAWLRMKVYVSQPFNERRLEFDFTTYK